METAAASTGYSLLVEWANQQDNWVRALVAEAIETRKPFTEPRIEQFYEMLLREKELAPGGAIEVAALATKAEGAVDEEPLFLETLYDVQNVNALAPGQSIAFNPRMNVLFGENGAGKTGYVRILKSIAAVRTAETVLPNINQPAGAAKPHAVVEYRTGTEKKPVAWNGESGLHPFTRIDLFDSRGVLVHVDQELTYTYTPTDLALFRLVHEAIERVKQCLDRAREQSTPKGNPFIAKFSRDTAVFAKIETLGPSTDLKNLETLATITPEEEGGLQALRERVEALRSTSTDARLQVATAEADVLRAVLRVVTAVESFDGDAYGRSLATLAEAEVRYKHATEEAFAGEDIPDVLSEAWRAFVEAGEQYIQSTQGTAFPAVGDACVYCRQPLGDAAVTLIKKYRDYCNNVLRKNAHDARSAVDSLTAAVRGLELSRLAQDLQKKKATFQQGTPVPPVFESAATFVEQTRRLQEATKALQPFGHAELSTVTANVRQLGDARLAEAKTVAEELAKQAASRKQALEQESAKLRSLEARVTLRELLPQVKNHVESAKWADQAATIAGRISRTIEKSLTEASKVASEQLLNQDFERLFHEECQALRAPKVSLDFPGRRGQPARRKLLAADYKLSDVLSEGEQKVIALADFIAEASLRRRASPVIFDDPVTSLDYKRLQYVVDRLVQIARTRQVVVFTHNIWFTMELLGRYDDEKDACAYYDVSDSGEQRGLISRGHHPRADTFKTLRGRINTLIQDAAAAKAADTRDALVEKAYEVLRGACEVIVETDLLQGVTQRYQPNVMMTKLPAIRGDRLSAAITAVVPVFDKACRYIASHSQPIETLNVRPTLDELRTDWKSVQDARDAYLAA